MWRSRGVSAAAAAAVELQHSGGPLSPARAAARSVVARPLGDLLITSPPAAAPRGHTTHARWQAPRYTTLHAGIACLAGVRDITGSVAACRASYAAPIPPLPANDTHHFEPWSPAGVWATFRRQDNTVTSIGLSPPLPNPRPTPASG
ncbi:hypothetical protein E2C01_010347 [Portunus trituberculatus]|uniref:Uncharacterized protein n=1 Tax=Portunus trituberculatus TaxID=210409 RepID=A0A5B7D852_PORTR|nr:hypothetical protein [Portunus trituberculatus]